MALKYPTKDFLRMPFIVMHPERPNSKRGLSVSFNKFVKFYKKNPNYKTLCSDFCYNILGCIRQILFQLGFYKGSPTANNIIMLEELNPELNNHFSELFKCFLYAYKAGFPYTYDPEKDHYLTIINLVQLCNLESKCIDKFIVDFIDMIPWIATNNIDLHIITSTCFDYHGDDESNLSKIIDKFIRAGVDFNYVYFSALEKFYINHPNFTLEKYIKILTIGFQKGFKIADTSVTLLKEVKRPVINPEVTYKRCSLIPILLDFLYNVKQIDRLDDNILKREMQRLNIIIRLGLTEIYGIDTKNMTIPDLEIFIKAYHANDISLRSAVDSILHHIIPIIDSNTLFSYDVTNDNIIGDLNSIINADYPHIQVTTDELIHMVNKLETLSFILPINWTKYECIYRDLTHWHIDNYHGWEMKERKLNGTYYSWLDGDVD